MEEEISQETAFDEDAGSVPTNLNDPIFDTADPVEPGPEDADFLQDDGTLGEPAAAGLNQVTWPADDQAPDYAYVAHLDAPEEFDLTAGTLKRICAASRYAPFSGKGLVAFALRGAELDGVHEVERKQAIRVGVTRPDHRHFRCIIGFWHLESDLLTAFTGSTVPCRRAIFSARRGGDPSNMLPTGLYVSYVWRHKNLRPALRMSQGNSSDGSLEAGAPVTILRTANNDSIDTTDSFLNATPFDNVHCSYFLDEDDRLGASFSSWGCLTVRGTKEPSHQWKKFQAVLTDLGMRNRIDLLVATGKDAALASNDATAGAVTGLRQGSSGPEVSRLQAVLGVNQTAEFGAVTADRFTTRQRAFNDTAGRGKVADGILTPGLASRMGLEVFAVS